MTLAECRLHTVHTLSACLLHWYIDVGGAAAWQVHCVAVQVAIDRARVVTEVARVWVRWVCGAECLAGAARPQRRYSHHISATADNLLTVRSVKWMTDCQAGIGGHGRGGRRRRTASSP